MGVYGFVCSGGGCIGALLGGVLTGDFNWHWIFLVNVPVGHRGVRAVLDAIADPRRRSRTPAPPRCGRRGHRDLALLLAVYATIDGNRAGWGFQRRPLGCWRCGGGVPGCSSPSSPRCKKPLVPLGDVPPAQPRGASICGMPVVGGACSPGSSSRRCTCSWCWRSRPCRSASPSCLQPHHGHLLLGFSAKLVMRFGIKPAPVRRPDARLRRARCCSPAHR